MNPYYYVINNKQIPNEEGMLAFLLNENVISISSEKNLIALSVSVNDHFVSAADGEDVTLEELPKLFDLYRLKGNMGIIEFVEDKRGAENVKK